MAESDEEGDITATYAYAPEGGLISMTRGSDTYYYQTNAHGDVLSLTDETGTIVNTYAYDPWGEVLSATETVSNPFPYATYYYDDCTGLYYLLHRYYDPGTREFLTVDPAVLLEGERYSYCGGNPITELDPFGLGVKDWFTGRSKYSPWHIFHMQGYEETGAARVTEAMNPIYKMVAGFTNMVESGREDCVMKGITWGFYGVLGLEELFTPFMSTPLALGSEVGFVGTAETFKGAARVTFGHGSRYLIGSGLEQKMVQGAIKSQIRQSVLRVTNG